MLAVLRGCGLRRSEVAALTLKHIQQRDGRWCIVDLVGKHGRVRTIPMPTWVKVAIDSWTLAAELVEGHVLRPVNRADEVHGERMSEKVPLRRLHRGVAQQQLDLLQFPTRGTAHFRAAAPQIMRRDSGNTCGSRVWMEELPNYLGTKQDLVHAPNDAIKLRLAG
jgi:integrase